MVVNFGANTAQFKETSKGFMENTVVSTKDKILDISQDLIQKRGFNAISFQDIADLVGIKKPSITHHFASKEALGIAVVQRYRNVFSIALNRLTNDETVTAMQALRFYFTPYQDLGETGDKICLCASLAGEFMALPADMQTEVAHFFDDHLNWLEGILAKGKKSGEFNFNETPKDLAYLFIDALQGSLIVQRATKNFTQLDRVIASLTERLKS